MTSRFLLNQTRHPTRHRSLIQTSNNRIKAKLHTRATTCIPMPSSRGRNLLHARSTLAAGSVPKHQWSTVRLTRTKSRQYCRQQSTSAPLNSEGGRIVSGGRFRAFLQSLREAPLKPHTVPVPRWISPRHYEVTLSEIFGHSSFILVAFSYAVDDHLHLRVIAVAGSAAMLVFAYFHPHGRVLWLPFKWNVLFIAINSYRIGKFYLAEWRANQLSKSLRKLQREHLYVVDLKDFAKLLRLGEEEVYEEGATVVEQGSSNRYIRLILEGECMAQRDAQPTYLLTQGNFVSESGLHAGLLLTGGVESCCAIVARDKVRVLRFDRTELMDMLKREKDLRRSLKAVLSWDIVRKLKGQRDLLVQGDVKDAEHWTLKRQEQSDARYDAILHNMLTHRDSIIHWKNELSTYRTIHHIDDEHHRIALKRFGWTPEEFEAGQFDGHEECLDDGEIKHDWKWRAEDIAIRLFG